MFVTFSGKNFLLLCSTIHLIRVSDLYINTYGFGTGLAGLANIGLGLGFLAATLFSARFADQVYHWVRQPLFLLLY